MFDANKRMRLADTERLSDCRHFGGKKFSIWLPIIGRVNFSKMHGIWFVGYLSFTRSKSKRLVMAYGDIVYLRQWREEKINLPLPRFIKEWKEKRLLKKVLKAQSRSGGPRLY